MSQFDSAMLRGMDPAQALQTFSETDNQYRIAWQCGSAEASRRQRVAGVGDVTQDGEYVRTTYSDALAALAEEDDNAVVEVLD
jgi:hypothetical protein